MPENESVFDIALYFIIGLFMIVTIYFIGFGIGGGFIYPMLKEMAPDGTGGGISNALYLSKLDHIWWGDKVTFYIFLVAVFLIVAVKLFYEREETSVY